MVPNKSALMRQSPDRANRPQDLQVLRADALDQHSDVAVAARSSTISPSAFAPVASRAWIGDMRRMTTRTSLAG